MLTVPNTVLTIGRAGCEGAASSWEIAVGLAEGNSRAEVVSGGAGEHRVLVLQAVLAHNCDGLTSGTLAPQPTPPQ